uniref:Metallo-beta-lactamase domain-containing protein n=1 Tax=Ananas comosus var. bracteatus TaxID=296719 RepID=A0A6V7Q4M1_ANACO|nr:unnamed protein product [Ananas comosus var. bracteatus]
MQYRYQVLMQVGPIIAINGKWVLLKYVEEAEFGPEPFVNTLFVLRSIENKGDPLQETCKWMSNESALKLLLEVKPCASRLGPLVVSGLLTHSVVPSNLTDATMLPCQEYPPGITLVPMKSRTSVPFRTTNLVIVHPDKAVNALSDSSFVTSGDTLIMDPGCCSQFHKKLADLVASLPRKLVVFVTHHHYDHIDGFCCLKEEPQISYKVTGDGGRDGGAIEATQRGNVEEALETSKAIRRRALTG